MSYIKFMFRYFVGEVPRIKLFAFVPIHSYHHLILHVHYRK